MIPRILTNHKIRGNFFITFIHARNLKTRLFDVFCAKKRQYVLNKTVSSDILK